MSDSVDNNLPAYDKSESKSDFYVMDAIRSMIANGNIDSTEKLTETSISKKLNLSRTPVRSALKVLAAEGILYKRQGHGYQVRAFTKQDQNRALNVRAILEAQAAKELALLGLDRDSEAQLNKSISMSEAIINRGIIDKEALNAFAIANTLFHRTIIQASGNVFLEDCLARLSVLPNTEIGAVHRGNVDWSIERLVVSHHQHIIIKQAIIKAESERAFSLFHEHVNASEEYHSLFPGDHKISGL